MSFRKKVSRIELKHSIIILLVLAIVTILNFNKYATFSFDLDEIFTIQEAKNINPLKYLSSLNTDLGNPPLFFILLKPLIFISTSEVWLRILPFSFYCLSVLVLNKILINLKLSKNLKLLIEIIFLGLAPFIFLRFYVRAYTLLLFFILLTIHSSFNLVRNSSSRELIKLMLIIILGLHSHYIYWVFIAVWILTALLISTPKSIINFSKQKNFLSIITISVFLSLPIIVNLLYRESFNTSYRYHWWQFESVNPNPLEIWEFTLKTEFTFYTNLIAVFLWSILSVSSVLTIKKTKEKNQRMFLLFNIIFWTVYFLTPLHRYLSVLKYISVFIIFLPISIAIILNKLSKINQLLQSNIVMLVCVSLAIYWSITNPLQKFKLEGGDDWKTVVNLVSKSSANLAIVVDCVEKPGFDHYSNDDLDLYGFNGFFSKNDCALPPIIEHAKNLEKILVVGGGVTALPIEDSHRLELFSDKYHPIYLYYYQKK